MSYIVVSLLFVIPLVLTIQTAKQEHVRHVLLLSSAQVYGSGAYEFAKKEIQNFYGSSVKEVLFIPYAIGMKDYDFYTNVTRKRWKKVGLEYNVMGIHEAANPTKALENAQAIYCGGGNTFRLLNTLYSLNLIPVIQKRVLEDGIHYMGSSAGSNVATASIHTTNDMPIVLPLTLTGMGLVSFNINPHYISPDPNSTIIGENRDDRIKEYLDVNHTLPVLGLKEGAWLRVDGDKATVGGVFGARLFTDRKKFTDIIPGTDVSYLLDGREPPKVKA